MLETVIARHRDKSFPGKKFLIRGTYLGMVTESFHGKDNGQNVDKSWCFVDRIEGWKRGEGFGGRSEGVQN